MGIYDHIRKLFDSMVKVLLFVCLLGVAFTKPSPVIEETLLKPNASEIAKEIMEINEIEAKEILAEMEDEEMINDIVAKEIVAEKLAEEIKEMAIAEMVAEEIIEDIGVSGDEILEGSGFADFDAVTAVNEENLAEMEYEEMINDIVAEEIAEEELAEEIKEIAEAEMIAEEIIEDEIIDNEILEGSGFADIIIEDNYPSIIGIV